MHSTCCFAQQCRSRQSDGGVSPRTQRTIAIYHDAARWRQRRDMPVSLRYRFHKYRLSGGGGVATLRTATSDYQNCPVYLEDRVPMPFSIKDAAVVAGALRHTKTLGVLGTCRKIKPTWHSGL